MSSVESGRVVLRGISWQTYEQLAAETSHQPVRLTYDRGVLELMSPSPAHEWFKKLIDEIITAILYGLRISFQPGGESRWRREAVMRGLEADECYYLSPAKLAIVGGRAPDQPDDPVPDLAVEIDLERPTTDRQAIYASLGVPEVWRFDGQTLRIDRIGPDGVHLPDDSSGFLPVRAEEVVRWIGKARGTDRLLWKDQLEAWVRDELAGRPRPALG